jgi:uncharacterized protein YegP (UPF0339 family)
MYKVVRKEEPLEFAMKCIPYSNKLIVTQSDPYKSKLQVLNEISIMQSNAGEHIIECHESYIDETREKYFVIM